MAASRKRRERRLFDQLCRAEDDLAAAMFVVSEFEVTLQWQAADDARVHADRLRQRVNSLEAQYRDVMRDGLVAA